MIRYNLQFFAEDGPGGEKTEPATAKKLSDARKKGQVAKSKDLTGSVVLLIMFIVLRVYAATLGTNFIEQFQTLYPHIGELHGGGDAQLLSITPFVRYFINSAIQNIMIFLLPFFAVAVIASFIADLVQVKWQTSTEPFKPKPEKFNPISGFKRIFSTRTLMNLLKSLLILGISGAVVYTKLRDQIGAIYNLYSITLNQAIAFLGSLIFDLMTTIAVIYLVIGIADYIFEKFKFGKDMKMTKQEVKDEWKNTEGDPEIKGKQKRRMMEASRRRMMASVPQADVVITNPTHYAVALKYEQNSGKAPVVVAKGEDYLALKIKEIAKENKVEIVENKPLARMIYYNVDLDAEIPPELYQAVAEILAFVYKQKHMI